MCIFRLLVVASVAAVHFACNLAWAGVDEAASSDFSFGGYSSAGIQIAPGGEASAALNEISLIIGWDGGGRWKFFTELELEKPFTWREGTPVTSKYAYVDVERLYADFNITGGLNLRGGRFLTPAGRWNLLHAAPLVWTATRPGATERLFPLALNGVMLHGSTTWGDKAIEYAAYAEMLHDMTDERDEIPFEDTRGLRLTLSSGLADIGLSLMRFHEDRQDRPEYRLLGLDFFKVVNGWEFSGEAYIRERSGGHDGGSGGYLQGVAPLGGQWFAIARVENLRDPDGPTVGRWLLGTAWRIHDNRVFKLEYVGGRDPYPEMPRGVMASYAILF